MACIVGLMGNVFVVGRILFFHRMSPRDQIFRINQSQRVCFRASGQAFGLILGWEAGHP